MLILQKYITKNVKFEYFSKVLNNLKFLKVFGLMLKISLQSNFLTDEDIFRIFSWILPWGKT